MGIIKLRLILTLRMRQHTAYNSIIKQVLKRPLAGQRRVQTGVEKMRETRWREAHQTVFGLRTILKSPRTALANAALPKALPTTALANAALPKESFSEFVVLYRPVVAGVSDP